MKPVIVVFGKASFFGEAPFVALEKFLIPRLIALSIGIPIRSELFDGSIPIRSELFDGSHFNQILA